MQSALDRRQALIEIMCERRHDKIDNLAFEFGVERRTIRRDIELLSISYPIYTTKGTGGGVHIVDGYRYGFRYMTKEETMFLESIAIKLDEDPTLIYNLVMTNLDRKNNPLHGVVLKLLRFFIGSSPPSSYFSTNRA